MSKRTRDEPDEAFVKRIHSISPFELLPGELMGILVLEWLDAAAQHFFFRTCRKYWFGSDESSAPCYARDKRPLVDVWRACLVHRYDVYIDELKMQAQRVEDCCDMTIIYGLPNVFHLHYKPRYPASALPISRVLKWGRRAYSSPRTYVISLKFFDDMDKDTEQIQWTNLVVDAAMLGLVLRRDRDEIFRALPKMFDPQVAADDWPIRSVSRFITKLKVHYRSPSMIEIYHFMIGDVESCRPFYGS